MNYKKNQPHYSEAMKLAIADIMEECHKEGKVFLAYNNKRTRVINIIIALSDTLNNDMKFPEYEGL